MNDLPPSHPPALPRPCSIEIEQALLGALLSNNDVYGLVSGLVGPDDFHDPVHRHLYRLIGERIARRGIADPRTLKPLIDAEPGYAEIGGAGYLVRLQDAAIGVHAAADYAREIGRLALRRRLIDFCGETAALAAREEPGASADEIVGEAERRLYALSGPEGGGSGFQSFVASMTAALQAARAACSRRGGLAGLATGFADLDGKLGGLQDTDLIVLAGRPGMGKTALAVNIALNAARDYLPTADGGRPEAGARVGIFSLEMAAPQIAARVLAGSARIPVGRIRSGGFDDADFERLKAAALPLQSCPIWIDDSPALPIAQLAIRARRQKQTHGLDLLIVDYLQLVRPSTSAREGRVHQVGEITRALKAIAKELDIPVIALSQLSRAVEGRETRRPQLADLRDSGSIEQDADIVMFVYRKEYYLEQEMPDDSDAAATARWEERLQAARGRAELIIAKHRQGPTGTINLTYDASLTRFGPAASPDPAEPGRERSPA